MKSKTCILILFLVITAFLIPNSLYAVEPLSEEAEEPPLTNAHILTMVDLGLGEEVIIEKIWEAPVVDFDLEVEVLGELKEKGVGTEVIAQMLKRNAAQRWPEPAPEPPPDTPENSYGEDSPTPEPQRWSVLLSSTEGNRRLMPIQGTQSSVYAFFAVLFYVDYMGHRSEVRTADARPFFLVANREPPRGIFFLVRTDPSSVKKTRSVKVGQSKFWSTMSPSHPDPDWVMDVQVEENSPGIWKLTPRRDLKQGEYGIWVAPYGELYDFAVDPPQKKKTADKGK